jgi:diaminopimelate decarboxylase
MRSAMTELHRPGLRRVLAQLGEIIDCVGTPLYVYDWPTLHAAAEQLITAAEKAGLRDRLRLYPALFALPNFSIISRLLQLDERIGITCNTIEEVRALRDVGFSDWSRVAFSGGVLKSADLAELSETEMVINASSAGNLGRLAAAPARCRIGARLDLYCDALKGLRESEIAECLGLLARRGKRLDALHSYRGTQVSSIDALVRHAELLLDIAHDLDGVQEVNLGGGFHYEYESSTGWPSSRIDFVEYFRAVRSYAEGGRGRFSGVLAWEPGRVLFAGCGFFVAEIIETRRTGTATADYYLDASFSQMPSPKLLGRQHHALVVSPTGEIRRDQPVEARLCGTTTLSTDLLLPEPSFLAGAQPGDWLVVLDAGAYGRAGAYHFLGKALPPEVLVTDDEWRLIRTRGQADYLSDGCEIDARLCTTTPALQGCEKL